MRIGRIGTLVLVGSTALTGAACTPGVQERGETDFPPQVDQPPSRPAPPPSFGPDAGPAFARDAPGLTAATYDPVLRADSPPPPISGGTLRLQADGRTAVASDPDRDKVYFVDLVRQKLTGTVVLEPGDEPGRHVEDSSGRVHVVLRRAGAVATLDPSSGALVGRLEVCPAPRGIAYDRTRNLLYVACAGGELVSLSATTGELVRRLQLDRDLRDVVVEGDRLFVSTFRKAEVLVLDVGGQVRERIRPPLTPSPQRVRNPDGGIPMAAPAVGWRMIANPARSGGVVLLHQRGTDNEIGIEPGGYGGAGCGSIVDTAVTPIAAAVMPNQAATLSGVNLGVDVAVSADGTRVAVASPGNARRPGSMQVMVFQNTPSAGGGCFAPTGVPIGPTGSPDAGASHIVDEVPPPTEFRQPVGEATAVAFDRKGNIIVQTRQPAALEIVTQRNAIIPLSLESRNDTGHAIFHSNPNASVTCASCHPEGGEDGRVWRFAKIGVRRTQSLRGGIMNTAPFHWDGEMRNLGHLMQEVFSGRMNGPRLEDRHVGALERWVEGIPLLAKAPPRDGAAVERGRALFGRADVGCATCHTGPMLTNNATVDVGTKGLFQVPSLIGVVWRAPYMHDGCAPTLRDRFAGCGGDDRHGVVSRLTAAQIADLTAYLESL